MAQPPPSPRRFVRGKYAGEMSQYAKPLPTLWVERVSPAQVKIILFMLSATAMTPTALTAVVFLYLQSALGMNFKPETIVAGVLLVLAASLFILWRQAARVFALIDAVPELQKDVKDIKDNLKDLKDAVRTVKEIGESILRKDSADEWRMKKLEEFQGRVEQEEREKRRRSERD